ncbi:unnamed protein product [Prunus armeniaca]
MLLRCRSQFVPTNKLFTKLSLVVLHQSQPPMMSSLGRDHVVKISEPVQISGATRKRSKSAIALSLESHSEFLPFEIEDHSQRKIQTLMAVSFIAEQRTRAVGDVIKSLREEHSPGIRNELRDQGAAQNHASASCKHQRRKCDETCEMAAYFPASRYSEFQNAHKIFGVSNIQKIMAMAAPDQRQAAAEAFSGKGMQGKMILCMVVLALSEVSMPKFSDLKENSIL